MILKDLVHRRTLDWRNIVNSLQVLRLKDLASQQASDHPVHPATLLCSETMKVTWQIRAELSEGIPP
jgi:hypothetical protein